ncbi:MAG TPA: nitroreductase/quinone reductase family protein [Anaerolineales bacterium]
MKKIDTKTREALGHDMTIDITTIGRRSGRPRRIEIWIHDLDGRLYLTGSPGRRSWYANLQAQRRFTLHLKRSVHADLAARAIPIKDTEAKRQILSVILRRLGRSRDLESWVQRSPLAEVVLEAQG